MLQKVQRWVWPLNLIPTLNTTKQECLRCTERTCLKKTRQETWRHGPDVKRACRQSRRPEFRSQHPLTSLVVSCTSETSGLRRAETGGSLRSKQSMESGRGRCYFLEPPHTCVHIYIKYKSVFLIIYFMSIGVLPTCESV